MYTRNGGAAKNKRARNYNNVSILCLHVECGDMQCNPPCRLAICCSPPCTPPAAASHSILACCSACSDPVLCLARRQQQHGARERETPEHATRTLKGFIYSATQPGNQVSLLLESMPPGCSLVGLGNYGVRIHCKPVNQNYINADNLMWVL